MIRIRLTSILVDDQAKALAFYTEKLGMVVAQDIPMGPARWLTVTAADEPDGTQLLLEPASGMAAAATFQKALYDAGVPLTMLASSDIKADHARMEAAGVRFRDAPSGPGAGPSVATFEDTCGNLIRLFQV